jgi:hypothetical protein
MKKEHGMVVMAWLTPTAPAEPVITSSVVVAEPPEPQPTPDEAPAFVYNPGKLTEPRRLPVNFQDETKIGYLDLATMAAVPASSAAGLLNPDPMISEFETKVNLWVSSGPTAVPAEIDSTGAVRVADVQKKVEREQSVSRRERKQKPHS